MQIDSLGQTAVQSEGGAVPIFAVGVAKASVGQRGAGGCDAAMLEQVQPGGGGRGRGRVGGRRLHGRQDESQAVGHGFVGSACQGGGMT